MPSLWDSECTAKAWDNIAVIVGHVKRAHSPSKLSNKSYQRRVGSIRRSSKALLHAAANHNGDKHDKDQVAEVLQRIPDYARSKLDLEQFRKLELYLQKALDSSVHPLGQMVAHLVDVYRATYVGVGAHPRLLPHAVAEVHSFVSRIYVILRLLFPGLPTEDNPCCFDTGNYLVCAFSHVYAKKNLFNRFLPRSQMILLLYLFFFFCRRCCE